VLSPRLDSLPDLLNEVRRRIHFAKVSQKAKGPPNRRKLPPARRASLEMLLDTLALSQLEFALRKRIENLSDSVAVHDFVLLRCRLPASGPIYTI
jgi:hypothetical protein